MKLYKLNNHMQEAVDYVNAKDEEILMISKVTKPTISCSVTESIPEKYFKTLDCEVITSSRRAYTVALADGDACITYTGDRRKEVTNLLVNYIQEKCKSENIRMALRNPRGEKCMVYAPIKNGVEFAIYSGNKFYCNNQTIQETFNQQRFSAGVSIDDLVEKIEKEFKVKAMYKLPPDRNHIKNMRGAMRCCNTGKYVFEIKKKIIRIKTPMVFDEVANSNLPKTSLLGFGGLNNTTIKDGFYEGDLQIISQDDEELEAENFIKEKGDVEWLELGQQ